MKNCIQAGLCIETITYRVFQLPLSIKGFPGGSDGKASACNKETWAPSLDWEDPLEEGMATHSSTLAMENSMDRGVSKNWRSVIRNGVSVRPPIPILLILFLEKFLH